MPFPAIVAAGLAGGIVSALASSAVQIVLKVLTSIGFGYLAFTGINYLTSVNQTQIFTLIGQLPPLAQQMLGVLQVGTCIKILFSALVMRLTVMGLSSGVLKKFSVTS